MWSTESIRKHLEHLVSKKQQSMRKDFAFTKHWLTYRDFDELYILVVSICDKIDANSALQFNETAVCANSAVGEVEIWVRCDGSIR